MKPKTVLTYGTFDLFHEGHYNILKRAKEYACGGKLIVGVATKEFALTMGKFNVIDSYEERCNNVMQSGFVDEIIPDISFPQKEFDIKNTNADVVIMGKDWEGGFDYCRDYGVEVVYFERTPNISTTLKKSSKLKDVWYVKDINGNLLKFNGIKPYKVGDIWTNECKKNGKIINFGEVEKDENVLKILKNVIFNDEPILLNDIEKDD